MCKRNGNPKKSSKFICLSCGKIIMENRQLINDHGEFIHNVLAGKGDEIVKNMPVISLKSDDFGKIIRMLTDDVDKYQKAIDMANELRIM